MTIDVALVLIATLTAHLLLENLEIHWARLVDITPYIIATGLVSITVLSICRLSQRIWRFASRNDYLQVAAFVSAIVCCVVFVCFAFNRLDGVARSLPILQGVLAVVLLIGAREFLRITRSLRRSRKTKPRQFAELESYTPKVVLIAGVTPLTEVYLNLFETLSDKRVFVAGILAREKPDVGRLLGNCQVLAQIDEIAPTLRELGTRGITVDRILVTETCASLSHSARDALNAVADQHDVALRWASDDLLIQEAETVTTIQMASAAPASSKANPMLFDIPPELNQQLATRIYWPVKRVMDICLALILIVVLLPLYALLAVICAIDVGLPILFWQQRPGLSGRSFRVYKFRTMRACHTITGRHLSDHERTSSMGRFIRSRRLDELPQLLAILVGKMSFVGPRPLLPVDQSHAVRCRLLIRPGLTGWAQVAGGKSVPPIDKAALDLWYIQNASLRVDIKILMRTALMLFTGEQYQVGMIAEAWEDLRRSGIVRLSHETEEVYC